MMIFQVIQHLHYMHIMNNSVSNYRNDAIEEIENSIINNNYDSFNTLIATFNSISDVDQFCNQYCHDNKYNGLKIGQKVQINDGTHNATWYIAGFDCEYNHTASDSTIKDNGYGICLIPTGVLEEYSRFHNSNSPIGYANSDIQKNMSQLLQNQLIKTLGSHLINRNVLLSNVVNPTTGLSTSYIWTTSYVTLISGCQLTGESAAYTNKYDDGEANYKLPLFNYMNFYVDMGMSGSYWIRGIAGISSGYYCAYMTSMSSNSLDGTRIISHGTYGARPMIYIR